jgi:hypothetical protein
MVARPFLPNCPATAAHCSEDGITRLRSGTLVLPWLGILARRDDRLCTTLCDRFMAELCVVDTISTDVGDAFVFADLVKQAWQHQGGAGGIASHFDSPNLQRVGIDGQVNLAPLTTVVGAALLGFPLTFAKHLDARSVDQEM